MVTHFKIILLCFGFVLFDLFIYFFRVYQGQKRSKEALPYYQKALEYTETVKDENSPECVPVLRELAGVEQALGFHDAAVNHFSRVRCNPPATNAVLDTRAIALENAWPCSLLKIMKTLGQQRCLTDVFSLGSEAGECRFHGQPGTISHQTRRTQVLFPREVSLSSLVPLEFMLLN